MTSLPSESRPLSPRVIRGVVAAVIAIGSVAPLVGYWVTEGRIPTRTPAEAKQLLRPADATARLVDVRPPEEFSAGHVEGAVSWPLAEILATQRADDVPAPLRDRCLLLVCDVGLDSGRAARHLQQVRQWSVPQAYRVRGGIQEWIRSAAIEQPPRRPPTDGNIRQWLEALPAPQGAAFDRWQRQGRSPSGAAAPDENRRELETVPRATVAGPPGAERRLEFPFRRSPIAEQVAAVVAYFVFKPTYMLLSLVLAGWLWKQTSADLAALRWGMLFFFLGETACAVNYFGYRETSYLWEYLHGQGMLLSFGFVTYAVLEGFDRRVLGLSDPARRCAAVSLCGACLKHGHDACGLQRVFYLIIPALMVVAVMLPTADWQDSSYNTFVFGTVYNYAHLRVHQVYENWYCAIAALVLFGASLAVLGVLADRRGPALVLSKIAFSGGVGTLGFGMLRMVLGGAYDQNRVWYLFWEETTELVFIAGVGIGLWIFRRTLVGRPAAAAPSAVATSRSA